MVKGNLLSVALLIMLASLLGSTTAGAQPVSPPAEEEESTITTEGEETAVEVETITPPPPETEPEPPPPPVEPEVEVEEVPPPPPPQVVVEEEEGIPIIEASWGKMKLGAVLQAQLLAPDLANKDDKRDVEFKLARMRLILTGSFLKDRIGYLVQGDMVNMDGLLLDARASLKFIKGLEIRFGRFIPDFTYFMPINVGKLMVIDYPVVTSTFAVWRQVGLEIIFDHPYFSITAGVFNGMRFGSSTIVNAADEEVTVSKTALAAGYMSATGDNVTDDNLGKDFLFRFMGKPIKGLELAGYVWYGMPKYGWLDTSTDEVTDDDGNLIQFGFEARYLHENFNLLAEYAMRRVYYPDNALTPAGASVDPDPLVAHGAFLHFGYTFLKKVEPMMRFDYFDSDMDSDLGQQIWGTLGLNYYIDGAHARLTAEYVLKALQRDGDPGTPVDVEYYIDHGLYFQLCLML